jgi:hypothetical protein
MAKIALRSFSGGEGSGDNLFEQPYGMLIHPLMGGSMLEASMKQFSNLFRNNLYMRVTKQKGGSN